MLLSPAPVLCLCLSWHQHRAIVFLTGTEQTGLACPPSTPLRSAHAELLPASPTGPTRGLAPSLPLTFLTAASLNGKPCPSAVLPRSRNSFSLLFLLFEDLLSPAVGWLCPNSGYLSLPATKRKDSLTFPSSVQLRRPLGSTASKL